MAQQYLYTVTAWYASGAGIVSKSVIADYLNLAGVVFSFYQDNKPIRHIMIERLEAMIEE